MSVTIQYHTALRERLANKNEPIFNTDLPHGATISDLLKSLQIELSEEALLIVVNAKIASFDTILSDGDKVDIIPAISGGEIDRDV